MDHAAEVAAGIVRGRGFRAVVQRGRVVGFRHGARVGGGQREVDHLQDNSRCGGRDGDRFGDGVGRAVVAGRRSQVWIGDRVVCASGQLSVRLGGDRSLTLNWRIVSVDEN